jgi:hypothetical protein
MACNYEIRIKTLQDDKMTISIHRILARWYIIIKIKDSLGKVSQKKKIILLTDSIYTDLSQSILSPDDGIITQNIYWVSQ